MKVTAKIAWLSLCIIALTFPLRDFHNGEAHALFGIYMVILTFPVGFALVNLVVLIGFSLDRFFGLALPPNEVMLIPLWLSFVALGYYQWFVLVPFFWRKWRARNT